MGFQPRGFMLRAFVVFRGFVFQTLLAIINQIQTHPADIPYWITRINSYTFQVGGNQGNPGYYCQ